MALSPLILYESSKHVHLLPQIAYVHIKGALEEDTIATLISPSTNTSHVDPDPKVLAWWQKRSDEVEQGERFLALQLQADLYAILSLTSIKS